MKTLFKIAAWLVLIAIVVLSVVPPSERPVTALPHDVEHWAIFLALGFLFATGYREQLWPVLFGLLLFCVLIEIVQLWIPGRHARVSDFLVDAAAVTVGLAFAVVANWIHSQMFNRLHPERRA